MAQYRVYLSDDEDRALNRLAKRLNQRPQDALRGLVNQLERDQKNASFDPRFDRLETQNMAVFDLLEIMAGELGHVAGVARLSTKSSESALRAAAAQESTLREAAASLRKLVASAREQALDDDSQVR